MCAKKLQKLENEERKYLYVLGIPTTLESLLDIGQVWRFEVR